MNTTDKAVEAARRALNAHQGYKVQLVAREVVDCCDKAIAAINELEDARVNRDRTLYLPGASDDMKEEAQKKADEAFVKQQAAEALLAATRRLARRTAPDKFYW